MSIDEENAPHDDSEPVDDFEQPMFDKPNLQLRDPDPYAFANRIRKLTLLASVLACVAVAPFLAGFFAYHIRHGQAMAEMEVAREALGDIAPQLQAFEEASRMIARSVGPSVVSIRSFIPDTRNGRPIMREGHGSGFIIDPDGYAVTNEHVVRGAQRLVVYMSDGGSSDATIVGADEATDLALLKIDGGNLPALDWSDSDAIQMGDLVWAIGSPFGLDNSVTFGIVSAKSRRSGSGVTRFPYQEYLQSDAAVNPGNSGGPLVNLAGQVVGVNTAILGERYQGVSLAIPSNFAQEQIELLRKDGFIERGFLGITPIEPNDTVRRRMQLPDGQGVLVGNVQRNTPAADAGLRRFDVILTWNDYTAVDPTLLSREISKTEIGSTANVLIRRMVNDAPIDKRLKVRVGRRTNGEPE